MAEEPTKPDAVTAKKLRGIVARGRSLLAPDPKKRRPVGYDSEKKETVTAPVLREFLPGDEIELPTDELLSLRRLGFIVDPTTKEHARDDGSGRLEAAQR
jgi:hypothetical protein